jgi:microcystin degradation protein MlrC
MPMKKKIAFVEVQQETNSFSPVLTTLEDFYSGALYYGDDVLTLGRSHKLQADGFLTAVEKLGHAQIEVVPVIAAWAVSGGPVERSVYEHFKTYIQETLLKHPDLAGIYLSMHGSMGVEGMRDPESDMLKMLRGIVGAHLPIAVSFDLHANLTREIVELSTFITSYRTNPHRDHFKVGFRTGKLLIDTVLGKIKPVMAYRKLKLLKGGGYTIDFLSPMRSIFRRMNAMESQQGVLSVSTFMVHIWLDDPELGWSTIAVTDGKEDLAEQLADELAELNWAVRDKPHPLPITPQAAIEAVSRSWFKRKLGTTVFCDVSDIVGAGAPGENTWLLKNIRDLAPQLTSYIPLRDKEAISVLYDKPLHTQVSALVGGRLEQQYNQPLQFEGTLIGKYDRKETGKTLVLRNQGTHLVLTERPASVFFPRFYREVGLNLWKADIVVVKNLFPFRYFFLPYNRQTFNVVSAGTTNIDVFQLKYEHIPRPIYPLDNISSWR